MQLSFFDFISKTRRNKILFYSLFSAFVLFLIIGLTKLKLEQDISATLPQGAQFKELNSFLTENKLNNQIAFSLKVDKLDESAIEPLLDSLTKRINASCENYIEPFTYYSSVEASDFYNHFYNQFPFYVSEAILDSLKEKLSTKAIEASMATNYRRLVSPESSFLAPYILKDPFSLTPLVLNTIKLGQDTNYVQQDGITYSSDKSTVYFFSALEKKLQNNAENQAKLAEILQNIKQEWNVKYPSSQLEYFSPFLIAVANAEQIKIDTRLTLGIFIGFVLLLLFWYYRKWSTPFFFLMPAIFGLLFSLGLIAWFKGTISAISVAAGAVVLGIILDYAFHFFTHYKQSGSLKETVHEISLPLLTGSFTTIVAFLALQYTSSTILKDFGLFAALSLLGAALFTLSVLPLILQDVNYNFQQLKTRTIFEKGFTLPFKISSKIYLFFILALSVFFFYQAKNIQFDSDIENLSFHPKDLKRAEQNIFKLNPSEEKKVFLFAQNKNKEAAVGANYKLFETLQEIKKVKQINSSAQFYIPKEIKIESKARWDAYWKENETRVFDALDFYADKNGFEKNAFDGFKSWINTSFDSETNTAPLYKELGIDKLVDTKETQSTFVSTFVVNKKDKERVLAKIATIEGIQILDRSSMASKLLDTIRSDFNYILLVSSLLVFLSLLVIYGRIELALIVFIPMLVSWIWIVGAAALLGIQFNFVNIIITTFIFGLGDDFSIFISDGILNRYKHGKNLLSTYKTAIILSALTTIVGTGVLVFAKHPAVHSIGFISVLGMLCILFISFTLQPILYDWLIFNRLEKKRSPWTFFSFLVSAFAYLYFFFGCMLASVIATLFVLIPMPKKTKRKGMATILHYFGASLIYIMFNVKKRFFDSEKLNLDKPSILVANHSSVLDILLTLTISPKVLMVTNNWVYHSPFFGYLVRTAGFILNTDFETNIDSIKEKISDGYSIMIFPEGTRSKTGELGRFKKGAFYLAEKLNIDITPVLIHGAHYTMSKSDFQLKNSWLNVKFLDRIKPNDFPAENYSKRAKKIATFFKEAHRKFAYEREDVDFLREPILYNYIYKGPVLEWYYRIKYNLEKSKYTDYENILAKHFDFDKPLQIIDLGCGYGFLDYFLHLKNKKRHILGVDYDENKISVAVHNHIKTENIHFKTADLRAYSFEQNYDVVFIMDVLHYFNTESQTKLVEDAINSLNDDGILMIRDGLKDNEEQHKNTKLTEFFSSNLGFNKKDESFNFFDQKFIEDIALRFGLDMEMKAHSDKTSNTLFILRKQND